MPRVRRKVAQKLRRRNGARRRRRSFGLDLAPVLRRRIMGYVHLAAAAILFLVLQGRAGLAGAWAHELLVFFFGSMGMLLPIALIASGLFYLFRDEGHVETRSLAGLGVCVVALLGFVHIQAPFEEIGMQREALGGAIGFMVAFPLLAFTSMPVAYVVLAAMLLIGLLLTFDVTVADLARKLQALLRPADLAEEETRKNGKRARAETKDDLLEAGMRRALGKKSAQDAEEEDDEEEVPKDASETINIIRPAFVLEEERKKAALAKAAARKRDDELEMKDTRFEEWEFPSLEVLDPSRSEVMIDDETLKLQARRIQEKLREFDIEVTMRDAHPGPTVTQFTLEPAEGVRLSRIGSLKSDLALALAAPSLRIESPIPGKSLVGVEMPNEKRTTVHLRELLESPEFRESESSLTLPLGRDVSGRAVVADLLQMPHLLIAGATGSGKSVCMNAVLLSLLYQNAPHELKFILIDPKRVEFSLYEGIPHLLTPVIMDAEKALKGLRWAVAEMGRRLAKFSEAGVRNLQEYNDKQTEDRDKLPRILIVIDELADLMMRQFRRDTEIMITRVAQIARATGMHLIIATQRPSVDVITGVIKANIPTRISFRTVSSIDSRTILDATGAEDLLGQGDMLYLTATTPVPLRIQGIFVSIKEVERVINKVKIAGGGMITEEIPLGSSPRALRLDSGQAASRGDEEEDGEPTSPYGLRGPREDEAGGTGVIEGAMAGSPVLGGDSSGPAVIDLDADDDGGDDLTFEAIDLVRRAGKASASLLQRHLKVGYARAARLLDILEQKGVVGPVDGAKPRKVYVEA